MNEIYNEVRLIGDVTANSVGHLIDDIEKARKKESNKTFTLYLASAGGSPVAAMVFYQYIKLNSICLKSVALGEISSSAVTVFLAGEHRSAVEGTHFLLHSLRRPTLSDRLVYHLVYPILWPKAKKEEDVHLRILREQREDVYRQRTKLSQEDIEKIRHGFLWLNVQQAFEKGIIHHIIK